MKYQDLYDEFIKLFPEDRDFFCEKEKETGAERTDGMHIMFGFIVCPYIIKIATEDPGKAQKAKTVCSVFRYGKHKADRADGI